MSEQPSSNDPRPPETEGNNSRLSSDVELFLSDPDSLSPAERDAAEKRAVMEAGFDGSNHKIVVELGGEQYWGKEYPKLFSFDREIRGNFESWTDNPESGSVTETTQAMSGPGGESSHVFFETDDGHMCAIRRTAETADEKSAARQEFEVISTIAHTGRAGSLDTDKILTRKISSQQLKGVFARPGEPLVLGVDPETGKPLRTRGNITRITSISKTEVGKVAPNHPILGKPEKLRDTPQKFMEAVRQARRMNVASGVGPLAVEHMPLTAEENNRPETPISTPEPLTEKQKNTVELQQRAEYGADIMSADGRTAKDAENIADDLKVKTTEYIRNMHQSAADEGRNLTDKEIRIIQGLQDAVRQQQATALILKAREQN